MYFNGLKGYRAGYSIDVRLRVKSRTDVTMVKYSRLASQPRLSILRCLCLQIQAFGLTLALCLEHSLSGLPEVGHLDSHAAFT